MNTFIMLMMIMSEMSSIYMRTSHKLYVRKKYAENVIKFLWLKGRKKNILPFKSSSHILRKTWDVF